MIVFLDLDGTLTDTAHEKFKLMKDGKVETKISEIKIFDGAKEFVDELIQLGHSPIIISDSHPRYVDKIASSIFNISALSLADKPNALKTLEYIKSKQDINKHFLTNKNDFIMVGDSYLDIELGRRLNIKTVFVEFYKATSIEERDGIGQKWKSIHMGPTYHAKSFEKLKRIIQFPLENLLALEAVFQNSKSSEAIRIRSARTQDGVDIHRCLARQEKGESDSYAIAEKYTQFSQPHRSQDFINLVAQSLTNYISRVSNHIDKYSWDYITYVSDKKTTQPPDKMKAIFDLVETNFKKEIVFYWDENVVGSLRNEITRSARLEFISKYFHISSHINIKNKNIIIIDDQMTTSATAEEISKKLRSQGAKNILFIALFYLIENVTGKNCSICKKPMSLKINSEDGSKFYSCVPPKYKGQGCGHIENIQ